MDVNRVAPDGICFITTSKYKDKEMKKISPVIKHILNRDKKPIPGDSIFAISFDSITDVIDAGFKDKIRAIVISPNAINIAFEIRKIKKEWPAVITRSDINFFQKKKIYFVIDILPCYITSAIKKHCHFIDCTNLYGIHVNSNDIICGEKIDYTKVKITKALFLKIKKN